MAEHTPTPWTTDEESCGTLTRILSPDGIMLVHAHSYPKYSSKHPDREARKANAAFIIKAANNHDALVEALTELHAMVWGECPSLLNEDSGGCARLDMAIRDVLDRVSSTKLTGSDNGN